MAFFTYSNVGFKTPEYFALTIDDTTQQYTFHTSDVNSILCVANPHIILPAPHTWSDASARSVFDTISVGRVFSPFCTTQSTALFVIDDDVVEISGLYVQRLQRRFLLSESQAVMAILDTFGRGDRKTIKKIRDYVRSNFAEGLFEVLRWVFPGTLASSSPQAALYVAYHFNFVGEHSRVHGATLVSHFITPPPVAPAPKVAPVTDEQPPVEPEAIPRDRTRYMRGGIKQRVAAKLAVVMGKKFRVQETFEALYNPYTDPFDRYLTIPDDEAIDIYGVAARSRYVAQLAMHGVETKAARRKAVRSTAQMLSGIASMVRSPVYPGKRVGYTPSGGVIAIKYQTGAYSFRFGSSISRAEAGIGPTLLGVGAGLLIGQGVKVLGCIRRVVQRTEDSVQDITSMLTLMCKVIIGAVSATAFVNIIRKLGGGHLVFNVSQAQAFDVSSVKNLCGIGLATFLASQIVRDKSEKTWVASTLWRTICSLPNFLNGIGKPIEWVCNVFEALVKKLTGKQEDVLFTNNDPTMQLYRSFLIQLAILKGPTPKGSQAWQDAAYRVKCHMVELTETLKDLPTPLVREIQRGLSEARVLLAKSAVMPVRMQPVSVMISGPAGVGKSSIFQWISRLIIERFHQDRIGSFGIGPPRTYLDEMFMAQLLDSKWLFEGYTGQVAFVWDDIGAIKDHVNEGMSATQFAIGACTSNGVQTQQATAELKGTVPFCSNLILMTTNSPSPKELYGKSANCVMAFMRRFSSLYVTLRKASTLTSQQRRLLFPFWQQHGWGENPEYAFSNTGTLSHAFLNAVKSQYPLKDIIDLVFRFRFATPEQMVKQDPESCIFEKAGSDCTWKQICASLVQQYADNMKIHETAMSRLNLESIDPLDDIVAQGGADLESFELDNVSESVAEAGDSFDPLISTFQEYLHTYMRGEDGGYTPAGAGFSCPPEQLFPALRGQDDFVFSVPHFNEMYLRTAGMATTRRLGPISAAFRPIGHLFSGAYKAYSGLIKGIHERLGNFLDVASSKLFAFIKSKFGFGDAVQVQTILLSISRVWKWAGFFFLLRFAARFIYAGVRSVYRVLRGGKKNQPRDVVVVGSVVNTDGRTGRVPSTAQHGVVESHSRAMSRSHPVFAAGNCLGSALHVAPCFFLLPRHFSLFGSDIEMHYEWKGFRKTVNLDPKVVPWQKIGDDVCLVYVREVAGCTSSSILSQFFTRDALTRLTSRRSQEKLTLVACVKRAATDMFVSAPSSVRQTPRTYTMRDTFFHAKLIDYEAVSTFGWCGSAVCLDTPSGRISEMVKTDHHTILGIHVAGNGHLAHMHPVTQEQIQAGIDALQAVAPSVCEAGLVLGPVAKDAGPVTPPFFLPCTPSKITHTPAYPVVDACLQSLDLPVQVPVRKELFVQSSFLQMPEKPFDKHMVPYLAAASDMLLERYVRNIGSFEFVEVLSDVENVLGRGKLARLEPAQSALHPWSTQNPKVDTRGELLRGGDFRHDFACSVATKEQAIRQGQNVLAYMPFPKDECRRIAKRDSPRAIFASTLEGTVLYRRYFGSLLDFFFTRNVALGALPGLQVYRDWGLISKFLHAEGDGVVFDDYDISGFDTSHNPEIAQIILDHFLAPFCDRVLGESEKQMRRNLWLFMFRPRYYVGDSDTRSCKDRLVEMCQGLPSGVPLTTFANTIYSAIVITAAHLYGYCQSVSPNLPQATECVSHCLRLLTYGDDNLDSRYGVLARMDRNLIYQGAKMCGLTLTNGSKDGSDFQATRLVDCTILKRRTHRVPVHNFITGDTVDMEFGLLAPSSIIGSLAYWKSSQRDATVWRNKLFSVLQELTPYYLLHRSGSTHPDASLYPILRQCVDECVRVMENEDISFKSIFVPHYSWEEEAGPYNNFMWVTRMILDPELTAARVHGWYFTEDRDPMELYS